MICKSLFFLLFQALGRVAQRLEQGTHQLVPRGGNPYGCQRSNSGKPHQVMLRAIPSQACAPCTLEGVETRRTPPKTALNAVWRGHGEGIVQGGW